MWQCVFQPVAANRYRCTFCGFEVNSVDVAARIQRVCTQGPDARQCAVKALRRDLRVRLGTGLSLRSWPQIERLIECCAACKDFGPRSCLRLRGCDARQKWLSLFTSGKCSRWPEEAAEDEGPQIRDIGKKSDTL